MQMDSESQPCLAGFGTEASNVDLDHNWKQPRGTAERPLGEAEKVNVFLMIEG